MNVSNSVVKSVFVSFLFIFSANAADFLLLNGKTDWSDRNSYTNNAVPTANDRIWLYSKVSGKPILKRNGDPS